VDIQNRVDPSYEISLDAVKQRAVRGVLALTGRTFVLNLITLVSQGFLWAYLDEYQFGVFWIVSAVVNFLVYFSDIGLAASLIQKKEKLTEVDLKTTFLVQQGLVLTLLAMLYVLSPFISRHYNLSQEGLILLYALGISFLMSSLKSIPSVLLERKLEFGKFIIPQVLETVVYNLVVVFFAWQGFGIRSFSYGVLARGAVGLIVIYILEPWKPGFAFSKSSLKKLLSFGLPYQANTFLAVFKDDGMTVLLGGILGPAGVGILGTAQRLSQYPLRFFMDNVTKVTFPAFSRMQDDTAHLERSVTRSIFFITTLVFPTMIGIVLMAPVIVELVPRYNKWESALIPLYLLSVNTFFASISTQLTNLLNAIGRIVLHFKLMIMWTALTFAIVPFLALKYGVVGAAGGYGLVGTSSAVVIYLARRYVKFSVLESFLKPLIASIIMGIVVLTVREVLPHTLFSVIILPLIGFITYSLLIIFLYGSRIFEDVRKTLNSIFSI